MERNGLYVLFKAQLNICLGEVSSPNQENGFLGQDFKPGHPVCQSEMPASQPRHSLAFIMKRIDK
jgi:hypothetical protein